jgi:RHS repeat-associated protein
LIPTLVIIGPENYSVSMTYDNMGGIVQKNQTASLTYPGYPGEKYNYYYTQGNTSHPHATSKVWDRRNHKQYTYGFDNNGNPTTTHEQYAPPQQGQPNPSGPIDLIQENYWDEQNQLRGLWNLAGLHHYIYDADGQRLMKSSVPMSHGAVNAQSLQATNTIPSVEYTVYVSAGLVYESDGTSESYTKHYYAGPLRVASQIGSGNPNYETHPTSGGNLAQGGPVNAAAPTNGIAVLGDLNSMLANYGMSVSPTAPPTDTIAMQMVYHPTECDQFYAADLIERNRCLCDNFPDYALSKGIDCSPYTPIYWYHPDYIGNVEFVTDRTGQPYQHFYYAPFGDPMVSQHVGTGSFNSAFRFNAKEYDEETGNYYYGARYYEPKSSVWMGVDAKATKYPGMNPYNFVLGNPIMAIDPDGNDIEVPDDTPDSEMTASDWRVSDRIGNTQRWREANMYNVRNGIQNQYQTFSQVGAFYEWIQSEIDLRGHEIRWAEGAIGLVNTLTALSELQKRNSGEMNLISFLTELNVGICNEATVEFGKLFNSSNVIRGQKAYEWDLGFIMVEQGEVAKPIYEKYRGSAALQVYTNFAYSNQVSLAGALTGNTPIPSFYTIKPSVRPNLVDDYRIRVDVPMWMLYGGRHNAIGSGYNSRLVNPDGSLTNIGIKYFQSFYVK